MRINARYLPDRPVPRARVSSLTLLLLLPNFIYERGGHYAMYARVREIGRRLMVENRRYDLMLGKICIFSWDLALVSNDMQSYV